MSESAGGNVKDWLLNKCKDASLLLQAEHTKQAIGCRRYGSVVLTPSNIPQFQIPRNLDVKSRDDSDTHSQSSDSLPCSGHTSPRLSPATREPVPNLLNMPSSPHSTRSAPVSPVRSNTTARLERFNTLAGEKVDMATNADPYSLAAMSLPHLKTITNFGFETLRESPNTRRKESLFHDIHPDAAYRIVPSRKSRSCDGSPLPYPDDVMVERRPSYKRRNVPSVVAPLGVLLPLSSNESNQKVSPFSRSPSPRESTSPRSAEKVRFRFSPKKEKRRTISPTSPQHRDRIMMPEGRRQSCGPRLLVEDADEPRKLVSNNNKNNILCKSLSMNYEFMDQNNEYGSYIPGTDYGVVDLMIEYTTDDSKLLVVKLLQYRGLLNKRPDIHISPFITVCLMPGKLQRQTSPVAPNSNETFSFRDISEDQLESLKVRLRLYNKVQGLRRKDFLGEAMVYLQDYTLAEPIHVSCQLQDKERNNKLGLFQISLCFQASLEKLTVIIMQAKDLPKNSLTGPPDAYVRVALQQPGRPESRIQTKIRKKSQNPVYNEEHLMTISPRIEDLNYARLTFTVYNRETIRSDEAIGQVRLGLGATEESEFTHWNNVLQNPGRDYTFWHTLMEPNADS